MGGVDSRAMQGYTAYIVTNRDRWRWRQKKGELQCFPPIQTTTPAAAQIFAQ